VSGIDYRVESFPVCAEAFRTVFAIPKATFGEVVRAVRNEHHTWAANGATSLPRSWRRGDKATLVGHAEAWWRQRLEWYDVMPNEKGVLVHEVCIWTDVYVEEFVPEMRLIGVAWGDQEDRVESMTTWREGKQRAFGCVCERDVRGRQCAFQAAQSQQELYV